MSINIAIDGPAGAGKSTIARRLAGELSFIYVDTGAMYRAMALYFCRLGTDPADTKQVAALCRSADIGISYENGEQIVLLEGENVNALLRTEEVSAMASATSAVPEVRQALLALQKKLASENNVIMDGRDIGTVILPNAQVKIFLTADPEVRAKRRYLELTEKGEVCSLEEILAKIEKRDRQDTERKSAPLRQAEDAILLDTSALTTDEVVDKIKEIVSQKLKGL